MSLGAALGLTWVHIKQHLPYIFGIWSRHSGSKRVNMFSQQQSPAWLEGNVEVSLITIS